MSFILHAYPLPYHTFAFRAAHGAQVAKSLKGDAGALAFATVIFENQEPFFGADLNTTWVDAHIVSLAAAHGYDAAAFAAGLADDNLNEAARIEWKVRQRAGVQRGVAVCATDHATYCPPAVLCVALHDGHAALPRQLAVRGQRHRRRLADELGGGDRPPACARQEAQQRRCGRAQGRLAPLLSWQRSRWRTLLSER